MPGSKLDCVAVVVDMTDDASIELAAAWKQEFVNKVSRVHLVTEKMPDGVEASRYEKLPCDARDIPVLLLGNKYDLVSCNVKTDANMFICVC